MRQIGIRPLALTIAKNASNSAGPGLLGFQRVADSYSVAPERRESLEKEITERLRQFSEERDDLLSEAGGASQADDNAAVGIGLFYFEDDDNQENNR
jgi:hypothetical protein